MEGGEIETVIQKVEAYVETETEMHDGHSGHQRHVVSLCPLSPYHLPHPIPPPHFLLLQAIVVNEV